ncbi:hypothetical protein OIU77_003109 [Salix suchowensis]|uniref:Uncharacterized protein n=1 Tax=Salix suchowensis TaxID=1278906 RepID=A0ABQ9AYI2_9ROSI|nr:hypothetical protein OIU77_003109 [Salix suchowensis]
MATVECGLGIQSWQFQSNVNLCNLCRILVGWDATKVTVIVVHMVVQWITCDVIDIGGNRLTRILFVYGLILRWSANLLWNYLAQQGTFNSTNPADLINLPIKGVHFTWHNGKGGDQTILKRLDWAFGNQKLISQWPLTMETFQVEGNIRSQSYCDSHDASSSSAKEEIQIPKFVDSSGGLSGCSAGNLDGGSLW